MEHGDFYEPHLTRVSVLLRRVEQDAKGATE